MKRMIVVCFATIVLMTGCTIGTRFHEAQFKLTNQTLDGVESLANGLKVYQKAANLQVNNGYIIQDKHISQGWVAWLDRHTDPKTKGLVSVDADGKIVPMPRKDLEDSLKNRDKDYADMIKSKASWVMVNEPATEAIADANAVVKVLRQKNIDWKAAATSTQAFVESAGKVAAGVVSGIVFGLSAN